MTLEQSLSRSEDKTIDLGFYYRILRAHLRTLGVFCGSALLLGILYLHVAPQKYTVTLQVTPVEINNTTNGSGLAGLASAAGITLPHSEGERQLDLYLAALTSPTVAQGLLGNPEIAGTFFPDAWDPLHRTWREPSSLIRPVKNVIKSILGFDVQPWQAPTPGDLAEIIGKNIVVDYKPTSPIVTITFQDRNPKFARDFLAALHTAADNELRQRAMRRATAYIAYLSDELKTVTSTEQRESLINTLSNQEALRMAAGANISYSVDMFSPPTASTKPTSPQPFATLLACVMAGGMAGIVYVLLRYRQTPKQAI